MTRQPMTLGTVLNDLGTDKTAAAAAPAAATPSTPNDAETLVAQKCAELLGGGTKTASESGAQPATNLLREKVAQLADAEMAAEVERQGILGAAYVDGAMRRYAAYVPVLEDLGILNKNASADMPIEKFAEAFPDIYKAAEALGYEQQRNEIAAIFAHGQKISAERVAALTINNASELFIRGFEAAERVLS